METGEFKEENSDALKPTHISKRELPVVLKCGKVNKSLWSDQVYPKTLGEDGGLGRDISIIFTHGLSTVRLGGGPCCVFIYLPGLIRDRQHGFVHRESHFTTFN